MTGGKAKAPTKVKPIVFIAATIIILSGLIGWLILRASQNLIFNQPSDEGIITQPTAELLGVDEASSNLRSDSLNQTVLNDSNKLIKQYQIFIDKASSNQEKANLHLELAGLLDMTGDQALADNILDSARQAEKLAPSAITAAMMAVYEEKYGDKAAVEAWNQLRDDRMPNFKEGDDDFENAG